MNSKLRIGLLLAALALPCVSVANTCSIRRAGSTDQTVYVTFIDATTGVPNASRAYNDSGIDLEYVRTGAAAVDITEATQTASGAHSDGGFVTVGHGRYRLDLPDAAVASGVPEVVIQGVITGYIMLPCTVALSPTVNTVLVDSQTLSASGTVTLPNATLASTTNITAGTVTVGAVNTGAIENQDFATAPGASGGLQIAGSNAATTYASLTVSGNTTFTGTTTYTGAITGSNASNNLRINGAVPGAAGGLFIAGTNAATSITSGLTANITGNVSGSVGSVTGAVGSVTGDIGGIAPNGLTLDAFNTDTNPLFGILRRGTAQSATGTTLVMDSGATFGDDTVNGATVWACGSTQGYCQSRAITDSVLSTDTLTVDTWSVTPSGTIPFYMYGTAPISGGGGGGDATAANQTEILSRLPDATPGAAGGVFIAGTNAATTVTTAFTSTFTGNLTGSVASVTGNVGGNVTGSVGSVATGGITANSIAADAIGASELAADAASEIGTANWATATRVLTAGTNIALAKGTGVTGFNDLSAAQVNSEVDTALTDIHLDHLLAADYDPASKPGVSTALLNELIENDGGVSRFTTNALENGPSGGGGGTNITQIEGVDATDALDARIAAGLATYDPPTRAELTTDMNSVLTAVGDVPTNAELATSQAAADDATLSAIAALNNLSSAQAQTAAAAALTAYDPPTRAEATTDANSILTAVGDVPTNAELATALDALPTAAENATAVGNIVVEDMGGGVSLKCVNAAMLAYAAGDLATSGSTSTYEDPSGTETRITGTVASAGNRSASVTCPSY